MVYAKTPLAGAAAVLDYLSRYTHRTAIGNERLVAIAGDKVLLRVRADATGGKRTVAIDGPLFIGRFLQHVLPPGFKRIRHYGLLAPATKADRLAAARALLAMPAPNPKAIEDAQAFMRRVAAIEIACCPHCKVGHWLLVQRPQRAGRHRLSRTAMTRCGLPSSLPVARTAHCSPGSCTHRHSPAAAAPLRASPGSQPRQTSCSVATLGAPPRRAQHCDLTLGPLRADRAETYTAHSTA